MEFKVIESTKDPLFNETFKLYSSKLGIGSDEDSKIFKHSSENNKTGNDYAFIIGIKNQAIVGSVIARYEAITNPAFLIYLTAKGSPNHDERMSLALETIEK